MMNCWLPSFKTQNMMYFAFLDAKLIWASNMTSEFDYELRLSSLDEYLETTDESRSQLIDYFKARTKRVEKFPHIAMLQVGFIQRDVANRWCFQQWGLADGECQEMHSSYPCCEIENNHSHDDGTWMSVFLAKTDYDYGFNEWYFETEAQRNEFVANLPSIDHGEKFPHWND